MRQGKPLKTFNSCNKKNLAVYVQNSLAYIFN